MFAFFRSLIKDRSAVTAIEYAMIACFIGIIAVAGAGSIGTTVSGLFSSISSGL